MSRWLAVLLLMLTFAAPAGAASIVWASLVPPWDETDVSGPQTFMNVDGSGVGISVSYTHNMFDRNSVPNIYTMATAPSPEIVGTLRFTNDKSAPIELTSVRITFSEEVFIDFASTVSLSTIVGLQENMIVEARDAFGSLVAATSYGTNTPALVQLDMDGDASYRSRGLGDQGAGLYGDTTYSWTRVAIKSLTFSIGVTEIGGNELVDGWSSQGIGNISFHTVPEPTTALLFGSGLLCLAAGRRRLRRR